MSMKNSNDTNENRTCDQLCNNLKEFRTYQYIVIYPTCFSQDMYIYTAFSVFISKLISITATSKLNNTNKDNTSKETCSNWTSKFTYFQSVVSLSYEHLKVRPVTGITGTFEASQTSRLCSQHTISYGRCLGTITSSCGYERDSPSTPRPLYRVTRKPLVSLTNVSVDSSVYW